MALAYHISSGLRPEKPKDAEAIGMSDSLWELIQRCWIGDKTRRPQIQEVVAGVGDAATNWHIDMPPSGKERREDAGEEVSEELEHGEFPLFPTVLFVFRPSMQLGYHSRLIRATGQLLTRL